MVSNDGAAGGFYINDANELKAWLMKLLFHFLSVNSKLLEFKVFKRNYFSKNDFFLPPLFCFFNDDGINLVVGLIFFPSLSKFKFKTSNLLSLS